MFFCALKTWGVYAQGSIITFIDSLEVMELKYSEKGRYEASSEAIVGSPRARAVSSRLELAPAFRGSLGSEGMMQQSDSAAALIMDSLDHALNSTSKLSGF